MPKIKNMQMLAEKEIDGYVADNLFRKRDPRFADYDRYKERSRKERAKFEIRQVAFFRGRTEEKKNSFSEKMKRKIDSVAGRAIYS